MSLGVPENPIDLKVEHDGWEHFANNPKNQR